MDSENGNEQVIQDVVEDTNRDTSKVNKTEIQQFIKSYIDGQLSKNKTVRGDSKTEVEDKTTNQKTDGVGDKKIYSVKGNNSSTNTKKTSKGKLKTSTNNINRKIQFDTLNLINNYENFRGSYHLLSEEKVGQFLKKWTTNGYCILSFCSSHLDDFYRSLQLKEELKQNHFSYVVIYNRVNKDLSVSSKDLMVSDIIFIITSKFINGDGITVSDGIDGRGSRVIDRDSKDFISFLNGLIRKYKVHTYIFSENGTSSTLVVGNDRKSLEGYSFVQQIVYYSRVRNKYLKDFITFINQGSLSHLNYCIRTYREGEIIYQG